MIFVTVGTHEQQFNRLIEEMDQIKQQDLLDEEVMIQTGFSTYKPKYCLYSNMIPYSDMQNYIEKARIVITHGGPASFVVPLQIGKIPIVVPRQKRYGEHINDHQMEFCLEVEKRMGNIIVVEDIKNLRNVIRGYEEHCKKKNMGMVYNNKFFNDQLDELVRALMN